MGVLRVEAGSLAGAPGAAVQIETTGRLMHCNTAFSSLVGYSEVPALSFSQLLAVELDEANVRRVLDALSARQLFTGEVLCLRKGGASFWNDLVLMPLAGEPGSMLALFRDVTARRTAEAALGVRAAKDRLVLDRIQAGIVVHKASTDILYANAKATELLGVTQDSILGAVSSDPRWAFISPDGSLSAIEDHPVARAVRAKSIVRDLVIGVTRASDRQLKWLMCNAYPVLDEHGEVTEVVVSFTDVTKLQQAERALQKSEERLRLVLAGSNDAPWDWDLISDELYYSPRWWEMLGYAPGELATDAAVLSRLLHPDDRDLVPSQLSRWLADETTHYEIEFRLQHKAGHFVFVLSRGHIVRGPDGKALRISGTNTDLTDRRALESRLRHSQKMEAVGQLAGGVAHDFNNLLAIIVGNLELFQDVVGPEGELRDGLSDALSATQRGAELTRRLLTFSRHQPTQQTTVDVGSLLRGLQKVLRRVIDERIHIEVRVEAGLPPIAVDPGLLENALLNLAINARDAMRGGGALIISADHVLTAQGSGTVRLEVTDTGLGMTKEVQDRALEPFFTTKPVGEGTGLGLSMVYGFMKQSGGTVTLRSRLGEGTTVQLDFPAKQPSEHTPPVAQPRLLIPHTPRDEVVLVVEDEAFVRKLCVRSLKRLGYHVLEADDGPAALSLLAEPSLRVDLLLTDMVMPRGLTGYEVATCARSNRPALGVVFMSGYLPEHFDVETRAKLKPMLAKPFSLTDLERVLLAALRRAAAAG